MTAADHKAIAKELLKLQNEKKALEDSKQNYKYFVSEVNDKSTFENIMESRTGKKDIADLWIERMYPVLYSRTQALKVEYTSILEEIIDVPTFEQYLKFRDECNVPNTDEV